MIFEPDIFSNKTPIWNRIDNKEINLFIDICKHIPKLYISDIADVYYSGAFEINSSNYRIESTDGKSILLKKWPLGTEEKSVEKIQRLTNWLYDKNIPVPYSGSFVDKSFVLLFNGAIWSFNIFNDGDYFSGLSNELESLAKVTGKLAITLFDLPSELTPEKGPLHLSVNDDLIITKMASERANWASYFGEEYTSLLNLHWDYIYSTWKDLYKKDLICGPIVPCHFDMHPHNLIAKDGEIVAVLDFDSCKKIPLGYSLAFNALKQCRQFLSLNKEIINYNEVKNNYLDILISEIKLEEIYQYDFLSLSKAEVMRRICLIFRINLMDNNSKWNHVLPIQIAHLYESDKLFKK
tara:strand:+ start:3346 stop:4398 length:1053 start_codon:yes stop_codon:yes gene_type:complete